MEENREQKKTCDVTEDLRDTEILDMTNADGYIPDAFEKTEVRPAPQRSYGRRAAAGGKRDAFVITGAALLSLLKLALLIFTVWFFSTQITFVMASPDAQDQIHEDGLFGIRGNVITQDLSRKLDEIKTRIDLYYLFDREDVDTDTGILKGYVESFGDPYTVYYSPEEYDDLMESTSGKYSGIGVVVQQNPTTGMITVVRPYVDGPGYEAGIRAEDIIYKVNGEEVAGQDLSLVVTKIKGEAGTTVDIQIYRPSTGDYMDMTVERRELEIETISHEMLENNIGCITMTSFDDVTYNQFMTAFNDLESQGMQALIVDIRDNGGGLLNSVTDILDELLPSGILTYTEDRDGNREYYRSRESARLTIPAAVLVNGNSASASEIFTGAMQDYEAAEIIGTQTFGKGIVQIVMALDDGSALKVTTSRYYTPNGVCIHGIGITPDVVVEPDPDSEEDVQLQKAIELLKEKIAD